MDVSSTFVLINWQIGQAAGNGSAQRIAQLIAGFSEVGKRTRDQEITDSPSHSLFECGIHHHNAHTKSRWKSQHRKGSFHESDVSAAGLIFKRHRLANVADFDMTQIGYFLEINPNILDIPDAGKIHLVFEIQPVRIRSGYIGH